MVTWRHCRVLSTASMPPVTIALRMKAATLCSHVRVFTGKNRHREAEVFLTACWVPEQP